MNTGALLERIAARVAELGTSEKAVSQAVASGDLIRNWRRAHAQGRTMRVGIDVLDAIARELQVSRLWLETGRHEAGAAPGLAEEARPFVAAPDHGATRGRDLAEAVWLLYGRVARNPAATHACVLGMPDFGLAAGDLVVCDLSRPPSPGDLVVVSWGADAGGGTTTLVRRFLPPWLVPSVAVGAAAADAGDPRVRIVTPIVGVIRGA